MESNITIAVITYNRCDFLEKNLPKIIKQMDKKDQLIVIDNNSTDKTKEFVKSISDKRISYVVERKQGLNHGRNTALFSADYNYVLYIDDDAQSDETWLNEYKKALILHPGCAIYAGKTINNYHSTEAPKYLSKKYEYLLGGKNYGERPRYLNGSESPGGGNMMLDRRIVLSVGGFDPDYDRKGNLLIGNGEKELWARLHNKRKCLYIPSAIIYHYAPADRTNKNHLLERMYWQGYSDSLVAKKNRSLGLFKLKRMMFYPTKFILESILRLIQEPSTFLFSIDLENKKTAGVYAIK
jgi:glycosyltransferase involved in cell wall biosynthesis